MINIPPKARIYLSIFFLSFVCLYTFLPNVDFYKVPKSDELQYSNIAYNLYKHQTFSSSQNYSPHEESYSRREPGYPIYRYLQLQAFASVDVTSNCLFTETNCPEGQRMRSIFQYTDIFLKITLVIIVFLISFSMKRSIIISLACSILLIFVIPLKSPSIISAVLFLLASHLASQAVLKNRFREIFLAGLVLSFLIFTKAVYQYLPFFIVSSAIALYFFKIAKRVQLISMVWTALISLVIISPWIARNYAQTGILGISGRSGEILAIRAEYDTMDWSEVMLSYLYNFPTFPGRESLLENYSQPDQLNYLKLERENQEGYYQKAKHYSGVVGARIRRDTTEYGKFEANLGQESKSVIKENFLKHLALTPSFFINGLNQYASNFPFKIFKIFRKTIAPIFQFLLLSTFLLLFYYCWKKNLSLILLQLYAFYNFSIHALTTHYIPRYNEPLVGLACLNLVLLINIIQQAYREKKPR